MSTTSPNQAGTEKLVSAVAWIFTEPSAILVISGLLVENDCDLSLQGATFLRRWSTGYNSLHKSWVLQEEVVGAKENELSVVSRFLTEVGIKGRIITADALHTQTNFCLQVTRWKGAYVLIAKGNQPLLSEDLRLFFSEPPADCRDWREASSVNKGHGRLEKRELTVSTELNEFLEEKWVGIAQAFRIVRIVEHKKKISQEIHYGLTSLSAQQADAARLLEVIRAHWAIENRLHYRRDVTLGEDLSQVRKGTAPRTLAVLNSVLLACTDFLDVTNLAEQIRVFQSQPLLAARVLLGSLLTFK